MQSAREHPQIIDYLRNETAQGRILGPYSPGTIPGIHTNRFGVIPKKHLPNKWRLITDLSFLTGSSVMGIPAGLESTQIAPGVVEELANLP